MRNSSDRVEFVRNFVAGVFSEDLHFKRIASLADGALGVVTGASLAVSMIGHALAQARGLADKHAIKRVDRLLSNTGVRVWDLFPPWIRHAIGERPSIVAAMDWTDFDADDQTTLALHHGHRPWTGKYGDRCAGRPARSRWRQSPAVKA